MRLEGLTNISQTRRRMARPPRIANHLSVIEGMSQIDERRKIVVVLKGYPRLSETFIAQELLGLERAGFDLDLISLRQPTDKKRHPVHDEIQAPVRLSAGISARRAVAGAAGPCCRLLPKPGFWRCMPRLPRRPHARPHPQPLPPLRPGAGAGGANGRTSGEWLHAHFIHTPASVTAYASIITGIALELLGACQGHLDVAGLGAARASSASARWTVTCTRTGLRPSATPRRATGRACI